MAPFAFALPFIFIGWLLGLAFLAPRSEAPERKRKGPERDYYGELLAKQRRRTKEILDDYRKRVSGEM